MDHESTFPFSLRFEPHSDVNSLFPPILIGDDGLKYISQLETVPAASTLYNVYATDKPPMMDGYERLIGTLVLDGQMTRSKWGDEHLFFRHQMMDDDVGYHPEWEDHLE